MMSKISPHFSREEFSCNCGCGFDAIHLPLLEMLEKIRVHFGKPLKTTSVNRCLDHNRRCNSKDTSQHVRGVAADIKMKGVTPQELYDYIQESIDPNGLGIYKTWIHIDDRTGSYARWDKRT